MNEKEKAKELVYKFMQYTPADEELELPYAKELSKITVNEIINNPHNTMRDLSEEIHNEFWESVLKEIDNI